MTEVFTGFAAAFKALWSGWWKALLGAAIVVAPAFLLGRCTADTSLQQAQASVKELRVDRAADATADTARRADDQRIAAQSQTVKDSTRALPDQAPTARQHARACSLLGERHAAADVLQRAGC